MLDPSASSLLLKGMSPGGPKDAPWDIEAGKLILNAPAEHQGTFTNYAIRMKALALGPNKFVVIDPVIGRKVKRYTEFDYFGLHN